MPAFDDHGAILNEPRKRVATHCSGDDAPDCPDARRCADVRRCCRRRVRRACTEGASCTGRARDLADGCSIPPLARSGLLAAGLMLLQKPDSTALGAAAWLFVAGIALFSGSLYALALTGIRGLGAVTPIGGLAFLGGWAAMMWAASQW